MVHHSVLYANDNEPNCSLIRDGHFPKLLHSNIQADKKQKRTECGLHILKSVSRLCLDFMISHCGGDITINQFH